MTIPVNPRIDPTDRSMFRDTMIRTMPVAMTATAADWTDRFHRLRAVRNDPPDRMLNPIQMTAVAPIRPSSRVSISIDSRIDRMDRGGVAPASAAATVLWLIERIPHCPGWRRALLRVGGAGREDYRAGGDP